MPPTSAPGLAPHPHRDSPHVRAGTRPTSAPGLAHACGCGPNGTRGAASGAMTLRAVAAAPGAHSAAAGIEAYHEEDKKGDRHALQLQVA